ncbi:MAG: hypothetical protein H0W87_04055 [Actinobacteria bacterium]|nr:hypothetical protein [Actinomycetota bacterium]
MNTFQSTISSPRNQRIIFWVGMLALAAGIVVLVMKLAGGSDPTPVSPDKGFKPALPAKSTPLKNADGAKVTNYAQLDPEIKTTIRRFVVGAVAGENYADSWNVIAPVIRRGYTAKTWATSPAHPIIPFPVYNYEHSTFTLSEASTEIILVDLKIAPKPNTNLRPTRFRIGLTPSTKGSQRWVVDYWMPLWTPPVADSSNNH